MKNRSIAAVILLPFITLGIYSLYWFVKTKGELNSRGANIPTAWLLIIPLVNIWWMWKYYEGAEQVTSSKVNGLLLFVLGIFVTSLISMALCQDAYNKIDEVASVNANNSASTPESLETPSTEIPAEETPAINPPTQSNPPTIPTV